ncbi:hypothetical protein FE257_009090 [Aspergillus nanangensis]|uniref:Non-reducing end beta-L-arabinofuranosidase-like GH127 middle domain-containing protein n=1 Tax=Aspergillus nanangensis TaxID=2582783 RepID=A0AAD4GYL3_ASPNN|nr:hypothetical protein FE257_009090 [Aspergillus nanangensis]
MRLSIWWWALCPILTTADLTLRNPHFLGDQTSRTGALVPYALDPLPLGSVTPNGWLLDQLQLMADGLPGHEHDFYRYVRDNPWVGGDQEYSGAHEALPYWFNGLVPLAYLTNNHRLKDQVLNATNYVLSHQQPDGWLGPETNVSEREFWARYPMLLGLTQLAEVEAGTPLATQILDAFHRFVNLAHTMLSNNYHGYVKREGQNFDDQWGRARAADMIMSLQWLYERNPRNQSAKLLDCMDFFYNQAYNWTHWYSDEVYPREDLDTLPDNFTAANWPLEHGVNIAEGLKFGAVVRRFKHDDQLANTSRRAVGLTMTYHGTPSGSIIADERLAGLSPVRGVELCTVVETMFSLSYIYHALGENTFADQCELAAYNALPVMTLPDWWAHQYVAQTNQPMCHKLEKSPFSTVQDIGQTFGLDPNYPCCTVNHPQGYPKYVAASYVREGENGIAHVLLGPTSVKTKTRAGVQVEVLCNTDYPFAHDLSYSIHADNSFDFLVRIPEWAQSVEIFVNEARLNHIQPDSVTGLQRISLDGAASTVRVQLSTEIRVQPRANDTVAIYHGALLYAIPISYDLTSYPDSDYPNGPPEVMNHDLVPTTAWAYAIDPSTLRYKGMPSSQAKLPNPLWASTAPTAITATVCEIDWSLQDGYAPNPPLAGNRTCSSDPFDIDLIPYGGAKLHMAELPVMNLR